MVVGCVTEIKHEEFRVGLTPSCVRAYIKAGHSVLVQEGVGLGAGYTDGAYSSAGAVIVPTAREVWERSDMIVKVKEPLESEYQYFRENLVIYTYLHLADNRPLTEALIAHKVKGVGFETMQLPSGALPCLKPMSEIAGRMSIIEGAKHLQRPLGGAGILLSGVPGVQRGKVAILGAGVVGSNALKIAVGLDAEVTILDINEEKLSRLDEIYGNRITTLLANEANIQRVCAASDLIIGAVLIPGARAPRLIRREHLKLMKKGTVMVDVAIDQGGCFETSHATYHDSPTFEVDGIIHYCVANMPGAYSRTASIALTSAILPSGLAIANRGLEAAAKSDGLIRSGLNTYAGAITCRGVAEIFGLEYRSPEEVLAG